MSASSSSATAGYPARCNGARLALEASKNLDTLRQEDLADGLSDAETEKGFDLCQGNSILHMLPTEPEDPRPARESFNLGSRSPEAVQRRRAARDAACLYSLMGSQMPMQRGPRVLCVTRRYERKGKFVDFVGEYHLDLIQEFGGVPIMLPRTAQTLSSLMEFLPMDGLLVVEGNDMSDDVLQKYKCTVPGRLEGEGAAKFASDTEFDVPKDELECALMRLALHSGCPILGLCRGSQMLNVLRGGTLIGDIASEVENAIEHLQPAGPTYDSFRHPIHVNGKTPLAEMFRDSIDSSAGGDLMVNSYHHQGVKMLGSGLVEMARAPDGVLEAFYDQAYCPRDGKYVVGLQFHPERMLGDYPGCKRVYEEFLRACHSFRQSEMNSFGVATP
mmetsp:Transcript_1135/g.2300  ORF Transcript_1135/g.2300 Transcript_1135/m.2300 type:complete len:388 (+) Transcript_1135:61-1224(+)|eukprot:CAMPEP_0197658882 /NCGR_PEP_ID=MMETSP1338-20131121/45506_1 /TAXON_ID=43686 ORGANISM="Pelagodinium beii, Strain RCC1491" /NCGR_SAMPLE_ID=MMETSP1338 /ASSEMBLY_ACC=CAM_ASM_000754 /LENGTH=387 /DNA_ID=CAMNT_0043235559 /DNA_START=53 /DNA_END=1216 /DNA_ORIENTATION=-